MLWTFQMTFFLFTVVFGASLKVPIETNETMDSYFQNMMQKLGMQKGSGKRQFQCSWNCQIVESDLGNITQTTVIADGRQLRLAFHYEKIVDDECVNRTSRNPSGNATEYWQVWLVNNTLPSFGGNAIRGFSALIQASFEDQVKVLCQFRNVNSSGKEALHGELSSPKNYFEKILCSTARSFGEVCDAQSENHQQTCIQISEFNRGAQWRDFVLQGSIIAFVRIFIYISPAIVCLYCATEFTCEGIRQINVEGPSPVGFRSLIGNYFFSADYTMWHRARKFIMQVVLLPIPLLAPAIFVEYLLYQKLLPQQNMLKIDHLFEPFRILCYGCYCVHAFYLHFLQEAERSCIVLDRYFDRKDECLMWISFHRELPQRMLRHLHRVGSIWRLLCSYCGSCLLLLWDGVKFFLTDTNLHSNLSPSNSVIFRLITLLIAFVHVLGIIYPIALFLFSSEIIIAFSFSIAALCTSPGFMIIWIRVNINFLHRHQLLFAVCFVVVLILDISLSCLSALGAMFVLRSAAVGALIFLQLAVTFVLSEDNLPFVACCVLCFHYLWNSYRSFTQKYQDLAVNLCVHYNVRSQGLCTTDNVKRIPKKLFVMACEGLMPIRKSICILLVKTSLSMVFIFLVFSLTMLLNTSTKMKSLVAFLAGSLLMIVNIYLNRRKQNNLEEKALKIVQEYTKDRLPLNRRQRDHCGCFNMDDFEVRDAFEVGKTVYSFIALAVSSFISLVVYLSFGIFRPCATVCLSERWVSDGRFY